MFARLDALLFFCLILPEILSSHKRNNSIPVLWCLHASKVISSSSRSHRHWAASVCSFQCCAVVQDVFKAPQLQQRRPCPPDSAAAQGGGELREDKGTTVDPKGLLSVCSSMTAPWNEGGPSHLCYLSDWCGRSNESSRAATNGYRLITAALVSSLFCFLIFRTLCVPFSVNVQEFDQLSEKPFQVLQQHIYVHRCLFSRCSHADWWHHFVFESNS